MKGSKKCLSLTLIMFFVFNIFLIKLFAEIKSDIETEKVSQTNMADDTFEPLIKTLNEALTKLGNRRLAILGFISAEGTSFIKEAIMLSDRVTQALIASGLFEVVDKTLLGLDNVVNLNIENAKKWSDALNLGSVLTGTIFKDETNKMKLNWRLVGLKDLTILSVGTLTIETNAKLRESKQNKQSILSVLFKKIEDIKATNLEPKKKEESIIKTIADFLKPAPTVDYVYTFFPCSLAKGCEEFNLNDGFYKIYYKDEFVVTVDKEGNILESYYYGKNNPVRKDIDLEKFLVEKGKK
ncbi:MAG: hypothetical protein NC925_02265 [Candidatus Omnitrophica bacterium]|nr:hypothetical protein [Candidatus Omnitrophota bacterium]MCM8831577.1 hypothetical protein [Candidatus Omnitrophota bacterium]